MPIFANLGFVLLNGEVSEVALPFRCQNQLHNLRYVNLRVKMLPFTEWRNSQKKYI